MPGLAQARKAVRPTKTSCFLLVAAFHTCCYDCQELWQLWRENNHLCGCFEVNCEPASVLRRLWVITVILLGPEVMMLRLPLAESLTGWAKFGERLLGAASECVPSLACSEAVLRAGIGAENKTVTPQTPCCLLYHNICSGSLGTKISPAAFFPSAIFKIFK